MKLKDPASIFISPFFREALHDVCFVRTKEQVGEKRITIGTYKNA